MFPSRFGPSKTCCFFVCSLLLSSSIRVTFNARRPSEQAVFTGVFPRPLPPCLVFCCSWGSPFPLLVDFHRFFSTHALALLAMVECAASPEFQPKQLPTARVTFYYSCLPNPRTNPCKHECEFMSWEAGWRRNLVISSPLLMPGVYRGSCMLSVRQEMGCFWVHPLVLLVHSRAYCAPMFWLACFTECEVQNTWYGMWIARYLVWNVNYKVPINRLYMHLTSTCDERDAYQGNFEFGISRIIKSLEPYEKKLGTDTWFYAKRCFLALAEQVGSWYMSRFLRQSDAYCLAFLLLKFTGTYRQHFFSEFCTLAHRCGKHHATACFFSRPQSFLL